MGWKNWILVAGAMSMSGCLFLGADEDDDGWQDEPEEETVEGECFDPVRRLDLDASPQPDRWRTGDVDGDGRADLLALDQTGPRSWRVQPYMGQSSADAPFVIGEPFEISTPVDLAAAEIEVVDDNGDGQPDLVTYGGEIVATAYGPLRGAIEATEHRMADLRAGTGTFLDFDDDGRTDLVMPRGNGDDLQAYRGTEDGYELVQTTEFDPGQWCVTRIMSYAAGDQDWIGVVAGDLCGALGDDDVRLELYEVGADGSLTEIASAQWNRDLLLDRAVTLYKIANFSGDEAPELHVMDQILSPVDDRLEKIDDIPAKRHGDFDGDGIIDHAEPRGSFINFRFSGDGAASDAWRVEWGGLDVDVVTTADIDGDGVDELIAEDLQNPALLVVRDWAPCE